MGGWEPKVQLTRQMDAKGLKEVLQVLGVQVTGVAVDPVEKPTDEGRRGMMAASDQPIGPSPAMPLAMPPGGAG